MNGWTPAETWLFIGFLVLAAALIVWAAIVAHQDRQARRSRLERTVADEAHMADLRRFQRELATPVDASGRVKKLTHGGGHE